MYSLPLSVPFLFLPLTFALVVLWYGRVLSALGWWGGRATSTRARAGKVLTITICHPSLQIPRGECLTGGISG